MVVFDNLWQTMEKLKVTEEWLIEHGVKRGEIDRLKQNKEISTRLVEKLCIILNCKPEDVMENRPQNSTQNDILSHEGEKGEINERHVNSERRNYH